jgi:Uncharacterized protein conserved in bacteria (DUF2188)
MSDKRIYVERRPAGDYAVRRVGSGRASDVARTQAQAIERAREISPGTGTGAIHIRREAR